MPVASRLRANQCHDDMVAVENGAGFVTGDLLCHTLGDPSTHHVPYRGAPEMHKELTCELHRLAGGLPGLAKVFDRDPFPMEDLRAVRRSQVPLLLRRD